MNSKYLACCFVMVVGCMPKNKSDSNSPKPPKAPYTQPKPPNDDWEFIPGIAPSRPQDPKPQSYDSVMSGTKKPKRLPATSTD